MRTVWMGLICAGAFLWVLLGAVPGNTTGLALAQDVIAPDEGTKPAEKTETPQETKDTPPEERATPEEAAMYTHLDEVWNEKVESSGNAETDRKAQVDHLAKMCDLCDEYAKKFPKGVNTADVIYKKAWLLYQLSHYAQKPEYREQALTVAGQVIADYPTAPVACKAHVLRMQILRAMQKYEDAIAEAAAVVKQFPQDEDESAPMAEYYIYDMCRKLKDETKADATLKELAEKFPQSTWGQKAQGMLKRKLLVGQSLDLDFTNGADEKPFKLSDYRGKVVLVAFWASTNPSSIGLQKQLLKSLYDRYSGDGLVIIGVNLDSNKNVFTKASGELGVSWVQSFDEKGFMSPTAISVGVTAIPSSILVDRQGKVSALDLELGSDKTALRRAVIELLEKK